jgi:hypothetical protein
MSTPAYQSFAITADGLFGRVWDGVEDLNGDGQLDYRTDFHVTPTDITYFNADGTPNVQITVEGTKLY